MPTPWPITAFLRPSIPCWLRSGARARIDQWGRRIFSKKCSLIIIYYHFEGGGRGNEDGGRKSGRTGGIAERTAERQGERPDAEHRNEDGRSDVVSLLLSETGEGARFQNELRRRIKAEGGDRRGRSCAPAPTIAFRRYLPHGRGIDALLPNSRPSLRDGTWLRGAKSDNEGAWFRGAKSDNDIRPAPQSWGRAGGDVLASAFDCAQFRAIQTVITGLIVTMQSSTENIFIRKAFFAAFCRRMLHIIGREKNARASLRETRPHSPHFKSTFALVLCRTGNLRAQASEEWWRVMGGGSVAEPEFWRRGRLTRSE